MGVLGAFGILGGLSVLLLPETGDRPMVLPCRKERSYQGKGCDPLWERKLYEFLLTKRHVYSLLRTLQLPVYA